jgi:hypothetical protein
MVNPMSSNLSIFPPLVAGELPKWPCGICKSTSWTKVNGVTVCGICHEYGARLRMVAELEQKRG